jgi:uncharacterized membrane protein YedE/YeeE
VSASTRQSIAALASGILFGAGLVISGMTQPAKVIAFLDVFGDWDPSLAFVMAAALGVHAFAYRVIKKRPSPLLAAEWSLPMRRDIDVRLLAGAFVFGVGWGLGGICPGPGIVSLASFTPGALVFVGAMVAAMLATDRLERWAKNRSSAAERA